MKYTIPRVSCRLALHEDEQTYSSMPVSDVDAAKEMIKPILAQYDKEVMVVVNLDVRLNPINWSVVAIGGRSACLIDMPEIFKTAILSNASQILLAHNHPSGDVSPSKEDDDTTERAKQAGAILNIPLVDHIIIGAGNAYFSYARRGI